MIRDIGEEIQQLLKTSPAMTSTNISEQLGISRATCIICLNDLIDKKIVYFRNMGCSSVVFDKRQMNGVDRIVVKTKNGEKTYYSIEEDTTVNDWENIRKVVKEETVNAKDTYDDLEEKYDEVSKNVNGLYANIISIISVFVAIFALITVNANITFKLTQENMYDVFWGIIEVNIFVVICIVILLVVTRVLIINPLLGKNKKKKDKRG